jgi:hypothetical protein
MISSVDEGTPQLCKSTAVVDRTLIAYQTVFQHMASADFASIMSSILMNKVWDPKTLPVAGELAQHMASRGEHNVGKVR